MGTARRSTAATSAAPAIGFLPTLAIILSVLGAALCAVVLYIHHQISAGQGGYTSFCDLSSTLSCDVVLASSYATVLGIPVAGWALGAYLVTGALAVSLVKGRGEARARAAATLAAVTAAMLVVSIYFFVISTFVIRVACPLCLSLDAVNVALFGVAVAMVRLLHASTPPGWTPFRFWLPAAGVTAAVVLGLVILQMPRETATASVTVEEIRERDPRFYAWYISQPVVDLQLEEDERVSPDAVTLVEFSDFQCPACARAFVDLGPVLARAEGQVALVHRNFPLSSECNPQVKSEGHENACEAAAAYECAATQGKAEEYARMLFDNQSALDRPSLVGYAARLGLDQGEFERCLGSPAAAAKVAADIAVGAAAGVESTPTFFINGRRVPGSLRPEHFQYAFAIERAGQGAAAASRAGGAP
ncbi:MAG: vitamin K epoxide reductase family protein [Thermodesulfobacteriota bacterium]